MNGLFKSNFITDIPINWDNAIHGINVIYPPTVASSNSNGFGICGEKFQPAPGPIFTLLCRADQGTLVTIENTGGREVSQVNIN